MIGISIYEDPKTLNYSWRTCAPFRLLQYLLSSIATIDFEGQLEDNADTGTILNAAADLL